MNGWAEKLRETYERLARMEFEDNGTVTVTQEDALNQLVFEAIVHFVERDEYSITTKLLDLDYDFERDVEEWVDAVTPLPREAGVA